MRSLQYTVSSHFDLGTGGRRVDHQSLGVGEVVVCWPPQKIDSL